MEQFNLCIASHPENLKKIRTLITDITQKLSCEEETTAGIILAVDETCSNIIRHAYQNDYTREIKLTITCQDDLLTIQIMDDGPRFDLKSAQPRDTSEVKPGGLGVHIIKQVMDTVEYCQTPEGLNQVKLIKKLHP